MQISTVYLQAFADPDGDGLVKEVWFPNRLLPMKADILVGLPGNYVPAQV